MKKPTLRGPTAQSLCDLVALSQPVISPDGKHVVCVATRAAQDRKSYTSGLMYSRSGAEARPLTHGADNMDNSPQFSPDGKHLVFVRRTPKQAAQLCILPLEGGEAVTLTDFKSGVSQPRFSPDGSHVAFLSRGDWVDPLEKEGLPQVITNLRYKLNGYPGPGLMPQHPLALWVYGLATGKAKRLARHVTDIEQIAWLPKGQGLVFAAARTHAASAAWASDLFVVGLEGKGFKRLSDWPGSLGALAVSPDGRRVACIADPDAATQTGDPHVYVFDLETGAAKRVAPALDVLAGNTINADTHSGLQPAYPVGPYWLGNHALAVVLQHGPHAGVYRLALTGGRVVPLVAPEQASVAAFAVAGNGTLAYLQESLQHPPELFVAGKQVSAANPVLAAQPEHVVLQRDGFCVEGWVLKPKNLKNKNLKSQKRHPVVLQVHGGPATAWGHAYMHEFHVLAAQGYAVAFCNIRGSTGYGDAQTAGLGGDYLQGDVEDLMAFLDACLARFSWLDPKRQAIVGGSYGGLMTNWVLTQTQRFKTAITDRSICNWLSFYGSSDIGYRFVPRELHGHVPQDLTRLWQMSPLAHVAKVATPCLIVHSEEDIRCPIEQAEQWFVALKTRNVPVRFVRVPGENHDLSRLGRPDRRVARLLEYTHWLARWL